MNTVAYRATYFTKNVGVTGVAMRTPDRRVFFRDDATETWRELFDQDAPHIHLHGQCTLILEAALADGDLVLKASQTVRRRAA
jgi:hypothetical protein